MYILYITVIVSILSNRYILVQSTYKSTYIRVYMYIMFYNHCNTVEFTVVKYIIC